MSPDVVSQIRAGKTPGELGFVMPIETALHECCWMAWAHDDHPDTWGADLHLVQDNFVRVATAISEFEKVRVIAHPEVAPEARTKLPTQVDVVPLSQGDIWLRDTGPLFVKNPQGDVMASNLVFNCWGEKFPEYGDDAGVGSALVGHLDVPVFDAPLRGEGGGLHVDGRGTVVTTETCFMNSNRNPGMTKKEIEQELFHAIGARKVIWLPGDEDEWITDGHIDGMLTFTKPGKVIFEINPDTENKRHEVSMENLKALQGQTDADGNEIEIGLIEEAYMVEPVNDTMALSYVNSYVANGGVVIPTFNTPTDAAALEIYKKGFPGREISQVNMLAVSPGGGGIHCMTQQQPA